MANNIEQTICEAIDIIVNKAVAEASYDKTIRASIIECVDASIGYYKLQYQDSIIYAYALETNSTYTAGTSVYVLVPADDMTNTKTILGTVSKLGTDYIAVTESDARYAVNGTNVLSSDQTFNLQSYKKDGCAIELYSKEKGINLVGLDTTAVQEYFSESDYVICGGTFQTALTKEQQYKGDFGIIFALDFLNQATNEVITRDYIINVDKMTGTPYNQISPTRQFSVFELDSEHFIEVNDITIYCYNFPYSLPDDECIDDIFISNIELSGASAIPDEDLAGYSLTFTTEKGTYFTSDDDDFDTLTIEAVFRSAGKIVNIDTQNLPVYWFIECAGVSSSSQYYSKYGGPGWKCLNDYTTISAATADSDAIVEWVPGTKILTIKKSDVLAKETKYKCSLIYNSEVVSATITIKNLDSGYDLTIESSNGTMFYHDVGSTDLTLLVNGNSERGNAYIYAWAVTDSLGGYTTLADTAELNTEYQALLDEYNSILQTIDNGGYKELYEDRLAELEKLIKEYENTLLIDKNEVSHILASSIYNFSTYTCSVYYNEMFIGTTSVVIVNSNEDNGYALVLNNSSYTYKYDESGVGPTSSSCISPIEIIPLSYILYDSLGEDITEAAFNACDVKWAVPAEDTLLSIPSAYTPSYEEDGYEIYEHLLTLPYDIATRYDISKQKNDIYLMVKYQGTLYTVKSNLTFVKEGETGTNGSEYSCKIAPNALSSEIPPEYLLISESSSGSLSYNYTFNSSKPLKVQLYHNEELIFDNTESATSIEGDTIIITWEILANKYSSSVSDSSALTINSSSGVLSCSGYLDDESNISGHPANIVQATVQVNNDTTLYATFPVLIAKYKTSGYNIKLKEDTGFLYVTYTSDGKSPKYDNTNPFEISISKTVDGIDCDISHKDEISCTWTALGMIYEDKSWVSDISLRASSSTTEALYDNQQKYRPNSSYDGFCVTNAVKCIIYDNGTEIARIHIPIHFMINRYGLSSLNGWNGNSIQIDSNGGFILSPQVGAGHKNSDNSFTGIVLGDVKESNATSTETGLFGYINGQRCIFLDSSSGSATFGYGTEIISIVPGDNSSHSTIEGSGLTIDLTAPSISYSNGNFKVDENGYLTAGNATIEGTITATAGEIGGFTISSNALYTGNKSTFDSNSSGVYIGTDGIKIYNKFYVDSNGNLYATSGEIGGFTITSSYLCDPEGKNTYGWNGTTGVYLGTDGIGLASSLSRMFYVDRNGYLYANYANITGTITATAGEIGGWTIKSDSLQGGNIHLYSDGSMNGGSRYEWSIDTNGSASFSSITIGANSSIDSSASIGSNTTLSSLISNVSSALSTANSAYSRVVEIEGEYYDLDSLIMGWCWENDTTYIDGSKIYAGTVTAAYLKGTSILIYPETVGASEVGYIYVNDGTSNVAALRVMSKQALEVGAEDGTLYLDGHVNDTEVNISLGSTQNGYGALIVMGRSIVPNGYELAKGFTVGNSDHYWDTFYAGNTTIVVSDKNKKKDIEELPEKYLNLLMQLEPKRFKLINNTSDRYHVGYIAQDIEKQMANCGIDSQEFAGFVKDINQETGEDIYFLRYGEFGAIYCKAIQQLWQRIEILEAKLQEN